MPDPGSSFVDTTPVPDYASWLRLDGRVVVVIGGGQGIGRQMSHAAASVGARVCCTDIDEERAKRVAAEVGGMPWVGDVTRRSEVERLFAEVEDELGPPEAVADIVGAATWHRLVEIDDEEWDGQFRINLTQAFYVVQVAGLAMARHGRGGVLAFVASPDGITGSAFHAAYGAAKAGLISLVKTASLELAPFGIRVNAISPGSAVTAGHPRSAETIAQYEGIIPMGRMQDATDMAAGMLFLLSDLARNISGQTLLIDGATSAKSLLPRDEKSLAWLLRPRPSD
jgi:NAD(P)-dependent dehydrogenase (short-subunit alcohol dehydrogenase family)